MILRRGRGYAPAVVARIPAASAILAVGADLKNSVTLVVGGEALTSQHVGDLEHLSAYEAHRATIRDLAAMYEIGPEELVVAHDAHPHYLSTLHALDLGARRRIAVQHHRAHVASVLAERQAWDARVVGVAWDGTGYGDDGTIWGGEFFVGSLVGGLARAASLRPFPLPGGDAAARFPVQAAAGVLFDIEGLPDLASPPFAFPPRYAQARTLVRHGTRTFTATSAGRLFDAAAALLGFTGAIDYEGQAAVWLEELAWGAVAWHPLPFDMAGDSLDFRRTLRELASRRVQGDDAGALARAFHEALADGIRTMVCRLCDGHQIDTVVLSGGTFQNALLLERLHASLAGSLQVWTNQHVPPNDGGISLGQAALAGIA